MAKKHKKADIFQTQQPQNTAVISKSGKKIIAGGVGLLLVGFFLLTRTDPYGRNWASHWVPLVLLGAYGVIAAGILLADSKPSDFPAVSKKPI